MYQHCSPLHPVLRSAKQHKPREMEDSKGRSEEASIQAEPSETVDEDFPSSIEESSATKVYPDIANDDSVDIGVQSDTTIAELHQLESDNVSRQKEATLLKEQLTMMKLRLNTPNLDLAYRFGISESTVGRILKRWIYALDSRMSFAWIK